MSARPSAQLEATLPRRFIPLFMMSHQRFIMAGLLLPRRHGNLLESAESEGERPCKVPERYYHSL